MRQGKRIRTGGSRGLFEMPWSELDVYAVELGRLEIRFLLLDEIVKERRRILRTVGPGHSTRNGLIESHS